MHRIINTVAKMFLIGIFWAPKYVFEIEKFTLSSLRKVESKDCNIEEYSLRYEVKEENILIF